MIAQARRPIAGGEPPSTPAGTLSVRQTATGCVSSKDSVNDWAISEYEAIIQQCYQRFDLSDLS
jgi:hypothetical protein